MMSWKEFVKAVNALIRSNSDKKEKKRKWELISKKVVNDNYTPTHFGHFMDFNLFLKKKKNISILDHGCGSGITLFFLASKGYENIWGIDMNHSESFIKRKNACNKVFKIIFNTNSERIKNYNGKKINYKDNSFDYIFSQQVIEHVESNLLENYISEEKRILKKKWFSFAPNTT